MLFGTILLIEIITDMTQDLYCSTRILMEIHWCIFLAIRCCPIIGLPMMRSCSLMTLAVMPNLLHFTDSYVS